jgi:hypothetical protein
MNRKCWQVPVILLIIPFVAACIGFVMGARRYEFAVAPEWEQLPPAPSRIIEIIGADYQQVFFGAADNRVFIYEHNC